jgi:DNA-directed RNA polymerase subunit F
MTKERKVSHQDHDLTLEDTPIYVGHRLPTLAATIEIMIRVVKKKHHKLARTTRYLGFIRELKRIDPEVASEIKELRRQFKANYRVAIQILGSEKELREFFDNDQPFFDWLL